MNFNILLIDETNSKYDFSHLKEDLDSFSIQFVDCYIKLKELLKNKNTHLILINETICSLQTLVEIFNELQIDFSTIPILILENNISTNNEKHPLLIFDYITINTSSEIICNKINFCKKLLKKEYQHQENLQNLLYIDNLTKLPNRLKLIKDLQNDALNIDAIAILDIKNFKEINDFFGLKTGDNILKHVVKLIEEYIVLVKDKVTLYKFSADIYCIANNQLEHKDFKDLIIYIVGGIKNEIIRSEDYEIDISAVAGITFSEKKNKLITADLALQAAKKQNKYYLVFYEELDNLQEYEKNMLWTRKLKKELNNDNIIVYFQPLVNNQTLKVEKYECLVRMYDSDDDKVISPFFFLELSKKAGLYNTITKIVIQKSFKEFENLDFEFSINVSYEDIRDPSFIIFIENELKKYNVAKRVVWEILEDENIKDYSVLINFINNVKKLGCKVAIDDFGTGYSNFEHLLKMNVDYLKIDASLIKNIATDETSYKVVKTIIEFAKSLELKTISEFVENKEIYEISKELGATFSQGYLFSAPLPKPDKTQF